MHDYDTPEIVQWKIGEYDIAGTFYVRDNDVDEVVFEGTKRECFGYVREAKGLGKMPASSR